MKAKCSVCKVNDSYREVGKPGCSRCVSCELDRKKKSKQGISTVIRVKSVKIPLDSELLNGKTFIMRERINVSNIGATNIDVVNGKWLRIKLTNSAAAQGGGT